MIWYLCLKDYNIVNQVDDEKDLFWLVINNLRLIELIFEVIIILEKILFIIIKCL